MDISLDILNLKDSNNHRIITDMLHAMRELLGMKAGFVSEFVSGQRVFRYVDADDHFQPISVGGADPLSESYCQRVVENITPQLIPDATREPSVQDLAATQGLPVGAHVSVPIQFSDGSVFGTFCCFSDEPNESLNERDLTVFKLFAGFASEILEQQLKEQRSREMITQRIKHVIDHQQFDLHYQPIVNMAERRLVGHEVLTRFSAEPVRSPDKWFNEAVEVGLNHELEEKVIQQALRELEHFPEGTYLALNISPETLLAEGLLDWLQEQPLKRLVVEISEHSSVSMESYQKINDILAPLRARGLRLAVDDAGAGYASFRHILKLEPDIIKLDGSLTDQIDTDPTMQALAAAFVLFAEKTGAKIVAECVENQAELEAIMALQVSKVQGYHLGRPAPLEHYLTEGFWSP